MNIHEYMRQSPRDMKTDPKDASFKGLQQINQDNEVVSKPSRYSLFWPIAKQIRKKLTGFLCML